MTNYEMLSRQEIDRIVRHLDTEAKERGKALRALEKRDKLIVEVKTYAKQRWNSYYTGYVAPELCVEFPISCYATGGPCK